MLWDWSVSMRRAELRDVLDELYARYNRRAYVSPDPLEAVYLYRRREDRSVAGLVSACLAYGRVAQIVRNVRWVLDELGPEPAAYLRDADGAALERRVAGFQHRWTTGAELAAFLENLGAILRNHGSLEDCFLAHQPRDAASVMPGLVGFSRELRGGDGANSLVPSPEKGSACKRLHLYLRWMVRRDAVDPGCWRRVPARLLVIPLDTHMHRIARGLGLTRRKQANLATALEVTGRFGRMNPEDPLKYDFVLTRLGIRADMDAEAFLARCGRGRRAGAA